MMRQDASHDAKMQATQSPDIWIFDDFAVAFAFEKSRCGNDNDFTLIWK